jgi:hypothetical protein
MEILRTVIIVEDLSGLRKQRVDIFPYPGRSIANHAKSHLIFGNQAGFFDLFQSLTGFGLSLHLMPTEQMHNALPIDQIKAESLDLTPLAFPPRALGPMPPLTRPAPPGAVGSRGGIGPIDAQYDDGSAPLAGCHLSDAPLDLLTRRRYI